MKEISTIQQNTARIISYIFHPLWMPSFTFLLLFFLPSYMQLLPGEIVRFDLLIVMINTLFIPIAYTIIFYRIHIINSLQMNSREERILPLILYVVFSYVSYVVLKKVHQPPVVWQVMLVTSAIVFVSFLVTLKWKISLHMAGIGGFSGMLLMFSFSIAPLFSWIWISSLPVAGLLGASRLISQRHNPAEVYLGFLTGFFIAALLLWYMA